MVKITTVMVSPTKRLFLNGLYDTRERGLCREGQPRCQDGALIQRNTEPSVELCDDLDNDCDGRSDEDFSALGSACAVGQGARLRQGIMGCDLNNEGEGIRLGPVLLNLRLSAVTKSTMTVMV